MTLAGRYVWRSGRFGGECHRGRGMTMRAAEVDERDQRCGGVEAEAAVAD
jgi:hypothetical protein